MRAPSFQERVLDVGEVHPRLDWPDSTDPFQRERRQLPTVAEVVRRSAEAVGLLCRERVEAGLPFRDE
jgi:hypothetical protein